MDNKCLVCDKRLVRSTYKYCSNLCQSIYQYQEYIRKWKSGLVDGNRGISTRNISQHIKRYLIEKNGNLCSICGWNSKHPVTNQVPLEVDHIDGNGENNKEENLRLLCPNCHALTPNFRNLNKGNGRIWRKNRYLKEITS